MPKNLSQWKTRVIDSQKISAFYKHQLDDAVVDLADSRKDVIFAQKKVKALEVAKGIN